MFTNHNKIEEKLFLDILQSIALWVSRTVDDNPEMNKESKENQSEADTQNEAGEDFQRETGQEVDKKEMEEESSDKNKKLDAEEKKLDAEKKKLDAEDLERLENEHEDEDEEEVKLVRAYFSNTKCKGSFEFIIACQIFTLKHCL